MSATSGRLAVVGEALVNIVVPPGGEPQVFPGGSPLNVAVGTSRLGVDTVLLTQLGDDEHGRRVVEHVLGSGVTLDEHSVRRGARTSSAVAHLQPDGSARYTFDLEWTLGPRSLPERSVALHVGSIGAAVRPGREHVVDLAGQAAAQGLLVTFDPNARPAFTPEVEQAWRDVRETAALAGLVKLSDEDLEFLQPGASVDEAAGRLLGGRTSLVVVTMGDGGAVATSRDGQAHVRSRPTDVADTVGAGDSFMAALVTAVVEHGLDDLGTARLERLLLAAHQAAAVTVSRHGADPPHRHELPQGWPGL